MMRAKGDIVVASKYAAWPRRRAYEPALVHTLRRCARQEVPASLLERLAGGADQWRVLNGHWDIDRRVKAKSQEEHA